MKGGSLVEAYKKDAKASKKLDTVVVGIWPPCSSLVRKHWQILMRKKLSEVEKKALEQLKKILPTLGDSDEVTVDTQVKQGQHLFELRSTTFAFDRSEFASTQAREKLVKLGEILSQLDQPIPITIKGHTCSRGSVDYNQDLSQRRLTLYENAFSKVLHATKRYGKTALRVLATESKFH